MPRPIGEPFSFAGAPLGLKELSKMGYFQRHFWKVMTVLDHIAADETVLVRGAEDQLAERSPEYGAAMGTLPVWLDLFYVYFRILADRFCVELGNLASEQPGGWPRNFRKLVNADAATLRRLKAADAETLAQALRANREWFDHLTSEGHRGARDAIVHLLADPVVQVRTEDGVRSVAVLRETPRGYEERDLLALVSEVVTGLCSMLGALPADLWNRERFEGRDLVRSDGPWPAVERFFPLVRLSA
jgi:hypothetical protein